MRQLHQVGVELECSRGGGDRVFVDPLFLQDRQSNGIDNGISHPNVLYIEGSVQPIGRTVDVYQLSKNIACYLP